MGDSNANGIRSGIPLYGDDLLSGFHTSLRPLKQLAHAKRPFCFAAI